MKRSVTHEMQRGGRTNTPMLGLALFGGIADLGVEQVYNLKTAVEDKQAYPL